MKKKFPEHLALVNTVMNKLTSKPSNVILKLTLIAMKNAKSQLRTQTMDQVLIKSVVILVSILKNTRFKKSAKRKSL